MQQPCFLDFQLPKEEQQLLTTTRALCEKHIVPTRAEFDESGAFPEHVFKEFREAGIFRAMFDAAYGGLGLHPLVPLLITEIISE